MSGDRQRSGRSGFTILEMLISLSIATIVLICLTAFLTLGMRAWSVGGTQGTVDRNASYAVRRIIRDVREASVVEVPTADTTNLYFPQKNAAGDYIKGTIDPNTLVQYYRGTNNGTPSATGAYVWRAVSGAPESAIAEGVTQLTFSTDGLGSVRVTLALEKGNSFGVFSCRHTSRVIKLRNW